MFSTLTRKLVSSRSDICFVVVVVGAVVGRGVGVL